MTSFLLVVALLFSIACAIDPQCVGDCQKGDEKALMNRVMQLKKEQWASCAEKGECPDKSVQNVANVPCTNGKAGEYPCCNVDLLSFVSLASLGAGGDGNDIWGWYDTVNKKEWAIFGAYDGTSFVDITVPTAPVVVAWLPTQTVGSSWRDIKVYKNHAFIVSEASNHGMQVYDLTQLNALPRGSINTVKPTAHYAQFGSAHNIAINEETGYAYAVGSKTCSGGLHMVDIRNPTKPVYAYCYSADGYVHDTQCVVYRGPDTRYTNKEICFNFDEDTLTIADVTNKQAPVTLSRTSYTNYQYTHQGWLLEDNSTLLLDDELDELYTSQKRTRTLIWDVKSLTAPKNIGQYLSPETVIDHNLYIKKNYAYQANYCGGLRILDVSKATSGTLTQVGYFDVAPTCSTTSFLGSWSNYPYLPSGNIIVSSIERGLFVVKFNPAGTC